jgi:Predicted acyltransferases
MQRFSYSPPLDSLRALAVLSVIVFHFSQSLLPGGFLGVDLFFVLSAFLITSIILGEGTEFSFKSFYGKRIKRILPPLYTTLIATSIAGAFLLAKEDFKLLKESSELIFLFAGNLFFARQGSGYFDPQLSEFPLLHTWSLAIEEQFYFIWPMLLLGLLKLKSKYRVVILIAITTACFAFSEWIVQSVSSQVAYYSSVGRFGQMVIGAMAALLVHKGKLKSGVWANYLFVTGLFSFTYFIIFFHKPATYPGVDSFIPTLSCLALILGAYLSVGNFRLILSNKQVVWIGKISFSLYLWHWPVLALARYATDKNNLSLPLALSLSVLITITSVVSYYFIEQKTRFLKMSIGRAATVFLLIPATIIALSNLGIQKYLYQLDPSPTQRPINKCHDNIDNCELGAKVSNTTKKILAFGDSHTSHLTAFFDEIGKKEGWSAAVMSSSRCNPLAISKALSEPAKFAPCANLQNWFLKNADNYDIILIAARWELYPKLDPTVVAKSLELLKQNGREIIFFSQVRRPAIDPRKQRAVISFAQEKTFPETEQENTEYKEKVQSYGKWIDLYTTSLSLPSTPENYFDYSHLSENGAKKLAQLFEDEGGIILNPPISESRKDP